MIRHALPADSAILFDLLLEIFQDMELDILTIVPPQKFKKIMVECMQQDFFRYSYKNGIIFEEDGEIQGCCFGYKGELEKELNEPFQRLLVDYGITSSTALFPDAETFAGEWYLDSLVTSKHYRGKGIASQLLQAIPAFALKTGETIIGLNCDQNNSGARKLYEKNGFKKISEMTLSGHVYDHMQKNI